MACAVLDLGDLVQARRSPGSFLHYFQLKVRLRPPIHLCSGQAARSWAAPASGRIQHTTPPQQGDVRHLAALEPCGAGGGAARAPAACRAARRSGLAPARCAPRTQTPTYPAPTAHTAGQHNKFGTMAYNPDTLSFDLPDTDQIYVSGLPPGASERDLEEYFGSIGVIKVQAA